MLTKLKTLKEESEDGFTLIELLVVILIIGILAAIAIPVFLNQRQTANDGAVKSDVRNAAIVVETAIVGSPNATTLSSSQSGQNLYICVGSATCTSTTTGVLISRLSESVTASVTGNPNAYQINAYHANGGKYKSGTPLNYNSGSGGLTNG